MRRALTGEDLAGVVRAAFGGRRRIRRVDRLPGGSKKGVYRLALDDASTVISYVWDPAENYWPARPGGDSAPGGDSEPGAVTGAVADPFGDASGAGLFEASKALLGRLGIRTPQVYLLDRTRASFPADVAVVADVTGGTLEQLLATDPGQARLVLAELAGFLRAMRQHRGPSVGKISEAAGPAPPGTCETAVLERALGDLREAAARLARLAAVHDELADVTHGLAAAVRPRAEYSLVHGELGPDHVLVDERGGPVLIDVEGLMFFDAEWEHAFLRLRFGEHYPALRPDGLDDQRLRFYALALDLSLIAGPLRLLDGDFPDRGAMLSIVHHAVERALSYLR
ncbi:MAG TPA: phosphotransferase [Streptosporangiaceae bacterium]